MSFYVDSNLITISSILSQTNIPGFTSGLDINKEGTQFSLELDSNTVQKENLKTETADNNFDNEPIYRGKESQDKLAISQKPLEPKDNPESTTQNQPKEENLEKISLNPEHELPDKSSLGQIIRYIENHKGIDIAELVNKYKEAKSGEIKGLIQRGKTPAGYKNFNSEKSKSLSELMNESTKRKNTSSVNNNGQIMLPEKTSIQEKLTDISKTIVKNQNSLTSKPVSIVDESDKLITNKKRKNETQRSVSDITGKGKESIIKSHSKAVTANGELPKLENVSLKDKSNGLKHKNEINERGVKDTFINNKNLINKQYNTSRGIIESPKINGSMHSLNNSIGDYNVKNVDNTSLQVSSMQIKGQNNLPSDNKTNSGFSRIAAHSHQAFIEEQNVSSVTDVKNGNLTQPGGAEDTSANIGKQILESIHSSFIHRSGDKQITVNLNPPELGQVSIKFQEQGTQLTGLLEVSKTQTRTEIEQALPQIIRNLSDSGINIKRLEVVLTTGDRTEQEAAKGDSLFYNQQQQKDFNNPSLNSGNGDLTGFHEWMASNINSISNPRLGDSLIVEDSINILI